jgi:[ribosomal protein S18]-alanine N-acetyltransferase
MAAISEPASTTALAERDDGVAGAFVLVSSLPIAMLASLAVRPDARRRGLGRRLLGAAIECARRSGARRVSLEVDADNAPALGLYRREGFIVQRRFCENGLRRLSMSRHIGEQRG